MKRDETGAAPLLNSLDNEAETEESVVDNLISVCMNFTSVFEFTSTPPQHTQARYMLRII